MEAPRTPPARPLWVRIAEIRTKRGWTWVRLERELDGVSRSTVDKWKVAPRSPQASTVNKVANRLGIDHVEALRLAGILPAEPEDRGAAYEELAAEVAKLKRLIAERSRVEEDLRRQIRELTADRRSAKPADETTADETTGDDAASESGRKAL
jgi:transcriptional regulator with XRE-family HTH domain